MKKLTSIFLSLVMIIGLAACSQAPESHTSSENSTTLSNSTVQTQAVKTAPTAYRIHQTTIPILIRVQTEAQTAIVKIPIMVAIIARQDLMQVRMEIRAAITKTPIMAVTIIANPVPTQARIKAAISHQSLSRKASRPRILPPKF